MSRKYLLMWGLLSLLMACAGGCAQKTLKSDKAAPPSEAAKTAKPDDVSPPSDATISDDEKRFLEVMEMLRQVKEESAKPPATPAATAVETTAAPTTAPVPAKSDQAPAAVKPDDGAAPQ